MGIIRDALRAVCKPIPDNDIWIAATARQHDLVLITRDAHFGHVPDLTVEAWQRASWYCIRAHRELALHPICIPNVARLPHAHIAAFHCLLRPGRRDE